MDCTLETSVHKLEHDASEFLFVKISRTKIDLFAVTVDNQRGKHSLAVA